MDDIRRERLIVSIVTLAAISCILINYFGSWEAWVPFIVFVGGIAIWYFHIAQKLDMNSRINLYFVYTAFLVFYHGIHETSLYDVSVVIVLFMATFTIAKKMILMDLILAEYGIMMAVQFYYLYRDNRFDSGAFETMRIAFHIGTVAAMYILSRININHSIAEKNSIEEWIRTVKENGHDMEDFLSNISHELRTPVNVISGMTAILQKNNDSRELVSIQDAGVRLAHQIEDIQDYTEIKRKELVLEEENYMCISLINDVVSNYRAENADSDLELIIDLDPLTPSMLKGDIKKLRKLFRHLLGNAVKFTKSGGILVKVFTVLQEYGCNLTIEVTDTGTGMTRAQMSRLSRGMYQANKKRNRSTGGIGIGLPIVYGFVHKMGGFVRIESERGRGTVVRLSIPQAIVDPAPCLSVNNAASTNVVFYTKPVKFMVPEVREFFRTMAVNMANGLGIKLYSAENARELEQLADEMNISYIFMGQEEYEDDRSVMDRLSMEGHKVVVYARPGSEDIQSDAITVLPKPLYGFPVVRILNGETGDRSLEEDHGNLRFTGVSALVVDDEPMNLIVASGMLREYKIFADTAESGKEAVRKFEEGEYDVIFMDHMMPGMDGVEAMKQIRQVAAETKKEPVVIALTANALSGAREMFIKEGFDGFIAKPIDVGEFERVMKRVLPENMIHYEGRGGQ
ncbi:MAG: response regulator [Lachnospiraceae bacterium]|nr:response regulator [Lachnospiraceae bacterium]